MYLCVQRHAKLTTCDPLQRSRMRFYHCHSCNWSNLSDQICPVSALIGKLSDEHLWCFATPGEYSATQCRQSWLVVRVYDCPFRKSCNYKIHQHTDRSYSPDDTIWYRSTVGLLLRRSIVDTGRSLAAFDSLCIRFAPCTPPATHPATGTRYSLSATREWMNSKCSAADSMRWRSYTSTMLSLADWTKWDLTLLTCVWTWYGLKRVISNMGRCFSIPLSRSPLCAPQMLSTVCYFAA